MDAFSIIFVCTGNICRSPMAEGIMKELLIDEYEKHGRSMNVEALSAGTHAIPGNAPSEQAVEAAAQNGINITGHKAQPIDDQLAGRADLILTMERSHKYLIENSWPNNDNVHVLKQFGKQSPANDAVDISDPYGMSVDIYLRVFEELEHECLRIFPIIRTLVQNRNSNSPS